MKQYPQKPPRSTQDVSSYFLTFCTFNREKVLHSPSVPEFIINELQFMSRKIDRLIAYTIMPDHIHLLVDIDEVKSLSNFLRDFKKYTSREIKRLLEEVGKVAPHRIWQPGTMDHRIRTSVKSKDFENHLLYIFFNSKRHLNVPPKDFPYHNFMEFVKMEQFDEDFLAFDEQLLPTFNRYE